MRSIGIILIALGIIMLVIRGISYTTQEKVVDIGPLEINKKEKKSVGWPTYAGGIAVVAGIALVLADRKK
jgi:UDP-N-acetylmuramyl pentapeptide phosphotransferase/UDP-N-acetylglucosamine-1-phosphate transferase